MLPDKTVSTLLLLLLATAAAADAVRNEKQSSLARCASISWSDYQTGMIFNSPNMQTVYKRSQCLQQLAVSERDNSICNNVRERKSLLFDGSGISPERCRELVQKRITSDIAAAQQVGEIHKLQQVIFARNGNGRDIDIHVSTKGDYSGKYQLTVDIFNADGMSIGHIYDAIQMLGLGGGEIVQFIKLSVVQELLGSQQMHSEYKVVTTLRPRVDRYNRFVLLYLDESRKRSETSTTVDFSTLQRLQNW
jgi:hypothetical protein